MPPSHKIAVRPLDFRHSLPECQTGELQFDFFASARILRLGQFVRQRHESFLLTLPCLNPALDQLNDNLVRA